MKRTIVFFKALVSIVLTIATTIAAYAQDSIQYQLVIRNTAGQLITNKQVNMKFSLVSGGQSFYEETQKTTTDKFGNISVFVGTGTALKGSMKDVPWSTMDVSLKVESDVDGGEKFKELGIVPIAASPYAMYAATAGGNANGGSPKDGEPLFEVCDRDGQPVFAVYNSGVVVYVDENDPKAKRSGLVVTGRKASKDGELADYFAVDAEGTHIYIDDNDENTSKAKRSGLVVTGRKASKDGESADYFAVDAEGTHIYIDDADENTSKAKRSGLVVTGRSASKSATTDEKHKTDDRTATKVDGVDIFAVNGGLTTVYINDADDKAKRSGFVVTGRPIGKGGAIIDIDDRRTNLVTKELTIGGNNEETPEPQPGEELEPAQNKNLFAISSGQVQVNTELTMIGDAEKMVEAEIQEVESDLILIDNDHLLVTVECNTYLKANEYALMAIYSEESYVPVAKRDNGEYIILFDESGFITKQHSKAAALLLLRNSADAGSKIYLRALKPMQQTIEFGLMDAANTDGDYQFAKLTANIDATESLPYELAEIENGKVNVKGELFYGNTVTLTAEASNGYYFKSWSDNYNRSKERRMSIDIDYAPLGVDFGEAVVYVGNEVASTEAGEQVTSVAEAVRFINSCIDANASWTIKVVDNIVGPQQIGSIRADTIKITGKNNSGENFALHGPLDFENEIYPDNVEEQYTVLTINTEVPVIIENLTITQGYADCGGISIAAGGNVTIGNGALISDNYGANGGGVSVNGSESKTAVLTVTEGSQIIYNNADQYGGGIYVGEYAALYMTGGVIDNNVAEYWGGGIYGDDKSLVVVGGNAVIGNTEITDGSKINREDFETYSNFGNGIYSSNGDLYIGYKLKDKAAVVSAENLEKDDESQVVIQGNVSEPESGRGGGVYFWGGGTFKMYKTTVACNLGHSGNGSGSGVCVESASGSNNEIDKCLIRDNYDDYGCAAGLFVYSLGSNNSANLTVSNTDFYNNKTIASSNGGGAVLVRGANAKLNMDNCKVYNNDASQTYGGSISIGEGNVVANNCQFYDNTGLDGIGVVVWNGGVFTISGTTTLTGDDATVRFAHGGDYPPGTVAVDNLAGTGLVATIIPDDYNGNPTLLSGTLTPEIISRFSVAPKVDETTGDIDRYYIDGEGKLQRYTAVRFRNVADMETRYLIPGQTIECPAGLDDNEKNGITHHFAGWYFDDPQTKQYAAFDNTTVGNEDIDVYAFWNAEIAVPQTGISTIADAVGRMCNRYCDYTIKISGTLGGTHTISKIDDVEIAAASITLQGEGSDAAVDVKSNNMFYSTALTINTAVPVEIKNLKITGGEVTGNGGGLKISSISTVTLADGAIISGNKCTGDSDETGLGGGVYNEGTLFIYGSAVIGDKSAESAPVLNGSCSNTARRGGGLYNAEGAHAYLGYKSETEEAELTGGIYYNYTLSDGSGVYNNGNLVMNSGNIAYNGTRKFAGGVITAGASSSFKLSGTGSINNNVCQAFDEETQYGGGVRVCAGSTFEMTGGVICDNEADWGGGVSVLDDVTTFAMTGGTVRGNNARKGNSKGAMFEGGSFKMGKRAVFEGDNDIKVNADNVITITEAFDNDIDCAATITPASYEENQVLDGIVNTQVAGKFALSNNEYYINESGVIKKETVPSVRRFLNQNAPNATDYPLLMISTEAELIQLATWVNGSASNSNKVLQGITFKLAADIELTNAFTAPIGTGYGTSTDGKSFWGTFDGNGYAISGLNTSNYETSTSYPALFGNVAGTVKNLTVNGSSTQGGIVGCVCGSSALIENCISNVEITATETDAGGIAADARGGTIRNCTNNGKITSTKGYVGGIVGSGSMRGLLIDDCVNNGEITAGGGYVGGVIGQLFNSAVRNCANTQSVTGIRTVGGIVGVYSQNTEDNSYGINNCYNKGNVKGETVGGIVGKCELNNYGNVRSSYNVGGVTVINSGKAGGVIGESSSGGALKIESIFYLNSTATSGIGGTIPDGVAPTSFENNQTSLSGLRDALNNWLGTGDNNSGNIYKTWVIKEGGDGYPEFAE